MKKSTLATKQEKRFRKEFTDESGVQCVLVVKVRFDDQCGNGHNSFAVTADLYDRTHRNGESSTTLADGKRRWWGAGGWLHDEVEKRFPELAHLLRWHLCSTDGPMHYIANTVYHAGDKDCWGLRKGEARQIRNGRTGKPSWILEADKKLPEHVDADECPTETATLRYVPWNTIGDGKERDLDAARKCAVWPDATDGELTEPGLEQRLADRLPALLESFRDDVEGLGFVW